MRQVRAMIWVATLFFLVMLFMPLVREAMRRASEGTPPTPF
jgi:preprotein translocase subunit SecG